MNKLIAIPYPAPSIPAAFRLYHGGWSKGGQLQPHRAESGGFLGHYVYFSPRKAYAAEYVSDRRDLPARGRRDKTMFVVDARSLPHGCLVVMGADALAPIDGVFWDLFLFRNKVDWWSRELSRQGVRTWLLQEDSSSGADSTKGGDSRLLVQWLSEINSVLIAQDGQPDDLRGLQPQTIELLLRMRADLGLQTDIAVLSLRQALAHPGFVAHQLNHPLLLALSMYGTADLAETDVRALADVNMQAWLAMHARPFRREVLPLCRDVAAVGQARSIQEDGGQIDGYMTRQKGTMPGDIVMVPGPIDVLRRGFESLRRARSGTPTRAWD